jgi:hypothetical protein
MADVTTSTGRVRVFLARIPRWSIALLMLIVVARLILPWILWQAVNDALNSIPGYYGSVDNVSASLWRGAYGVYGVKLVKLHGREDEPFFSAREIDISLDWPALLHSKLVTKIELIEPQLQFIQRATPEASQTKIDESWQNKVRGLYAFQINRFLISRGLVRYKDETKEPKINLYVHDLHLDAENITNAARSTRLLPTSIELKAKILGTGNVEIRSAANLLAVPMVANTKGVIRHLALTNINDFAKAYGDFDFKGGDLQVTFELAATSTRYRGYVKTLLHDVKIFDLSKDSKKGPGHLIWEGLAAVIVDIFTNHHREQFAARIPLEGSRQDLKIDTWETAGSILRNAFVKALSPKFEDVVEIQQGSAR